MAKLNYPFGVAVDSNDNVYIADRSNHVIRKIDTDHMISTIAGNGSLGYSGDGGLATSAQLNNPWGVAVDSSGNIYIADSDNNVVRKVDPDGNISTFAGNGTEGSGGDGGPAASAQLGHPTGLAIDSKGNLYIANVYNAMVRKVDPDGNISTVFKGGVSGTFAAGVAVDSNDNLYIAWADGGYIVKIDTDGVQSVFAGIPGTKYYTGDGGPATEARLNEPHAVAVDSAGNVYIADTYNHRIRKVDLDGNISTVAGNGVKTKDKASEGIGGPATSASISEVRGLAIDSKGNLYMADFWGSIKYLNLDGIERSGDASLSSLTLSSGTLRERDSGSSEFSPDKTFYQWYAPSDASLTITPTSSNSGAVIQVDDKYLPNGTESEVIDGKYVIINLMAENGVTYSQYRVDIFRTFTVNFDSGGGSHVADLTDVAEGKKIIEPAAPTKAGYTFEGWYKEASHDTLWNFSADTVTGDTTLYAKWTAATGGSSGGSDGDGGSGPIAPDDSKVISDNGELTLPAGEPGEVSLDGDKITIEIPADVANEDLKLTIEKWLDTQSLLSDKEVLLSDVFEILKNFKENFKKPVKLTFAFNQTKLSGDEHPSIFYYDEAKKVWIEVGGVVDGNFITAEVDHFTKFAVLAVSQSDDEPKPAVFSDIAGHWAEDVIEHAVSEGIVSGYPDGTFRPNDTVTRAEFAVMLTSALKLTGEGSALTFTDAAKIPSWARKAVQQAVQAGMISGYEDGTFRPEAQITRSEMAVMIAAALKLDIKASDTTGFADDESIPSWSKGAIAKLRELDLMVGYGGNRFNPAAHATRAEAVTILMGMLER